MPTETAGSPAPPRVLMVDDRPDNLVALEAVLAPLGLELLKAGSGTEALRLLLDNEVSAMILDAQMPEMDGFETATLAKSRAATRDVPIIFLTAVSHEFEHQLRGYEVGAIDYVCKPFDPDVMRAKVRALVDLSSVLQALERENDFYRQALAEMASGSRSAEKGADPPPGRQALFSLERLLDLELPGDLGALVQVRNAVRAVLDGYPQGIADTAALLLNELVANAVVHAQSPTRVRVDVGSTVLRAEVLDHHATAPRLRGRAPAELGGLGLVLLGELSSRSGWTTTAEGKSVWFELALPGDPRDDGQPANRN